MNSHYAGGCDHYPRWPYKDWKGVHKGLLWWVVSAAGLGGTSLSVGRRQCPLQGDVSQDSCREHWGRDTGQDT